MHDWMDVGRNAIRDHKTPDWLERGDHVAWATRNGALAAWIVEDQSEVQQVKIRMVGDDRDFLVDRSEVKPITEDDFCGGCGQIGCGHG